MWTYIIRIDPHSEPQANALSKKGILNCQYMYVKDCSAAVHNSVN